MYIVIVLYVFAKYYVHLYVVCLLLARLMGQYCFARWCPLSVVYRRRQSASSVVVCNAAGGGGGRRARGRTAAAGPVARAADTARRASTVTSCSGFRATPYLYHLRCLYQILYLVGATC